MSVITVVLSFVIGIPPGGHCHIISSVVDVHLSVDIDVLSVDIDVLSVDIDVLSVVIRLLSVVIGFLSMVIDVLSVDIGLRLSVI